MFEQAYQELPRGGSPLHEAGWDIPKSSEDLRDYKKSQLADSQTAKSLTGFPDGATLLNQLKDSGRSHLEAGSEKKDVPAPDSNANAGPGPEETRPGREANIGEGSRDARGIQNHYDIQYETKNSAQEPDVKNRSAEVGSNDDLLSPERPKVGLENLENALSIYEATGSPRPDLGEIEKASVLHDVAATNRTDPAGIQNAIQLQDVIKASKNASIQTSAFPPVLPNRDSTKNAS